MHHPDLPPANMRSAEDPLRRLQRKHVIEVVPRRHEEQPERRLKSKSKDHDDNMKNTVPFWRDLIAAFEMCQGTIDSSRSFRKTDVGRDWLEMIRQRIDWLKEDERKIMGTGLKGNDLGFLDDSIELQSKCRKHEDRIRRLRSRVIEPVAEKPSRAIRIYEDELTYDEKVRLVLRDTFKKVEKARRTYLSNYEKRMAEIQRPRRR